MALDIRNVVNVGGSQIAAEEGVIDTELNINSLNPVTNQAITARFQQTQDKLTVSQSEAVNSGINSEKVSAYDSHIEDEDIHVTEQKKLYWDAKQANIQDLDDIRSGAALGATAVQSSELAAVATSGSYNDLLDKPTIPEGLPSQTGNNGKFLTTDGSTASWASVSGGGGGAPTLTWYTGNTGTTVTVSDTTDATLVKVYKNGLLLQPTEDYSISGTTLTLVTALVSTDKITVEVF